MKDGFIKIAAGTLHPVVADVQHNTEEILRRIDEAQESDVQLLVLPELCITGCTCGDLFGSGVLQQAARKALEAILAHTVGLDPIITVGLPLVHNGKVYNTAVVMQGGSLLGAVPKCCLSDAEHRYFTDGLALSADATITIGGQTAPFGSHLTFCHNELVDYAFGVAVGDDLSAVNGPAQAVCAAGARLLLNPSASPEFSGCSLARREAIKATAARLVCGIAVCNAGPEESTQDVVFSRHHLIVEDDVLLAENLPFDDADLTVSELDVQRLTAKRRRLNTYALPADMAVRCACFAQAVRDTALTRRYDKNPFLPEEDATLPESILQVQAYGLKKRLEHAHSATAVVGISGGLDSCLALLVMARAYDLMGRDRRHILAVTMPCFGTTDRTHNNAQILCDALGVTLREVNIAAAVTQHLADIGHDPAVHDVTYENAQARERTQILMDIANKENGLLVGTGDLSELALGWATYNGDHMSMYGVNASVPKTVVRRVVQHVADGAPVALRAVLLDILDTPVSPELLPAADDGAIAQKTEDLVGPYELHDFFLYHLLHSGFSPAKVYRLATYVFNGDYDSATILKWLRTFVRRFFIQQFKRSCMPDGPQATAISLSPRGAWMMPSDAAFTVWMAELDTIE